MSELRPPRTREEMDLSLFGEAHVNLYRQSNGEQGYIWNGAPILLLTTKGRASGQPRTSPLLYLPDGERIVIIASKGGAPEHPAWYRNLAAEPRVQVQIKGEVFDAVARTTQGPERERLWSKAVEVWPQFPAYQARTAREIPVVVLERVGD